MPVCRLAVAPGHTVHQQAFKPFPPFLVIWVSFLGTPQHGFGLPSLFPWKTPPPPPKKKKNAQVTSPTACGALSSARTTPQPSQNLVEPWWNPRGTLVEPSWNLTSGPREPIWAETPKLSAVGEKNGVPQKKTDACGPVLSQREAHTAEFARGFARAARPPSEAVAPMQRPLCDSGELEVDQKRDTDMGNIPWMVAKSVRTTLRPWETTCFVGIDRGIIILGLLRGRSSSTHSRCPFWENRWRW